MLFKLFIIILENKILIKEKEMIIKVNGIQFDKVISYVLLEPHLLNYNISHLLVKQYNFFFFCKCSLFFNIIPLHKKER